jgi:DNA-binding IclR family transcriptional regulator
VALRSVPDHDVVKARSARSLTVEKALQLLHVVADQPGPVPLVSLSRAAGLDKTTTHRLATSLARHGLLRFDSIARTYALGLSLLELGHRAVAQLSLPREARPHLERLGELSQELVNLGLWDDGNVVYADQVPSSQPVVLRARVGTRVPVHCTAMGKVLLAFGPAEWRERVVSQEELPPLTPNTITQPEELGEHLARVRRLGYAQDDEEHRLGVRCVAAPVRDHTGLATAAISIAGPSFRFSRERLNDIVPPLLEATRTLSAQLGFRGEPEATDGRTRT